MSKIINNWNEQQVVPYIRLNHNFRTEPFFQGNRRLLDYLVLYLKKGRYILTVEGEEYEILEGEFAMIQPGWLFSTRGFGQCEVPNAHLDFFLSYGSCQKLRHRPRNDKFGRIYRYSAAQVK